MSLARPTGKPAKQWQRSDTHPNEAVFVTYDTDPEHHNGLGCKKCFFRNNGGAEEHCVFNNCTDGHYVTLVRAAQLKVETS